MPDAFTINSAAAMPVMDFIMPDSPMFRVSGNDARGDDARRLAGPGGALCAPACDKCTPPRRFRRHVGTRGLTRGARLVEDPRPRAGVLRASRDRGSGSAGAA